MNFENPDPNLFDVRFTIDNRTFYFSKKMLARHSPVFEALFKTCQNKDHFDDWQNGLMTAEDFHIFLNTLHGFRCINDSNVEKQLSLGIASKVDVTVAHCLDWLMGKETMLLEKVKFDLAVKHNLDGLKKKVLSDIESVGDLDDILPADLATLDHATSTLVLQRILELTGARPKESD
ncbi:hypothetical protein CAEBREN_15355 [Caenorhabditis brenneri]|uniref:BTB domain-containing protein n=1 Tax=Caenorhabditis brenneri TaxID=135651 RepID=G0MV24_CAEBE|nr:hypothetical protein CAEBREN_15355 [Caenorhabditis brenneri]